MKKAKRAAVGAAIMLACTAAGYAAGQQTGKAQERQAADQEPQPGYILIHTTDGEAWGFCGDMKIISDGTDGKEIDIDMTGWLVGSTHDCYCPEE